MKSCPYCKSNLNRSLVDNRRSDGKKWYQLSTESTSEKYCSLCGEKLAVEQNIKWYYNLALPMYWLAFFLVIVYGDELNLVLKVILGVTYLVGTILLFKQFNDFQYVTFTDKKKKNIQNAIKYANGHFEKPIEFGEYCSKYSLTKNELTRLISIGLVEAYSIDGIEFLDDKAPDNET